jgi:hypothetical protein
MALRPGQWVALEDQDRLVMQFRARRDSSADPFDGTWVAVVAGGMLAIWTGWGTALMVVLTLVRLAWAVRRMLPVRHRLEICGDRVRFDGAEIDDVVIEEDRLTVEGVIHVFDGRLTARACQLLWSAQREARALRRAREGGSVSDELVRVVRRAERG